MRTEEEIKERIRLAIIEAMQKEDDVSKFIEMLSNDLAEIVFDEISIRQRF